MGSFSVSHTASVSLTAHVFSIYSVYKSRRAAVLKGGEKLKFLVPFASSSKFSGHEKEKFESDLRNFGSRDAAYVYLSDTHDASYTDH